MRQQNQEYVFVTLKVVLARIRLRVTQARFFRSLGLLDRNIFYSLEGWYLIASGYRSIIQTHTCHYFKQREDGTVRVWDIRRAAPCLMSLDQHNTPNNDPLSETNSAHGRGVNGLAFSSDGLYLITLGLDEKIRLWDTFSGRNMLVNYGAHWRNRFKSYMQSTASSSDVWPPLLYVPSDDHQVLVFELLTGKLSRRLKGAYGRVTCVERRPIFQELYSGSNDCEILVWEPFVPEAINENPEQASTLSRSIGKKI